MQKNEQNIKISNKDRINNSDRPPQSPRQRKNLQGKGKNTDLVFIENFDI